MIWYLGAILLPFFGSVARLPLVFGFDEPVISAADIPSSFIIDFSFFTATSFFRCARKDSRSLTVSAAADKLARARSICCISSDLTARLAAAFDFAIDLRVYSFG